MPHAAFLLSTARVRYSQCQTSKSSSRPTRRNPQFDAPQSSALDASRIFQRQRRGEHTATPLPSPPTPPQRFSPSPSLMFRQPSQVIILKHHQPPSIPKLGPQRFVELDSTLVPIQNFPAQRMAALALGDAGDRRQQGFAHFPSPKRFPDKQVPEEHLSSSPGAVEIEEDRISRGLLVPIREQHAELGLGAKPITRQIRLRG